MKKKITIHRTRIGKDIVAEYVVPPTASLRKKGRVAIIAKGVPGGPGASTFLSFLAEQGFYAILPRYRGTWESAGLFLQNDPTEDIKDVLNALKKPLVSLYEKKEYEFPKNPKVYLMVGSFGGPAGFFLSSDPRVTAVFAYAPVVDWRVKIKSEPLSEFQKMVNQIWGEGYRFDPEGMKKLKKGTFYNPATARERIIGDKVHMFHTKDDDIVVYEPVFQFAQKIGAHMSSYPKGGHGGASSLMEPRVWKKVMQAVEGKNML